MNNIKNAVRKFSNANNHSRAVIESVMIAPYYGAAPQQGYRLLVADHNGFVYHVSCYETIRDAEYHLTHDCGHGFTRVA
jgi:hypothetical protein